jgi:hypothetical protein
MVIFHGSMLDRREDGSFAESARWVLALAAPGWLRSVSGA